METPVTWTQLIIAIIFVLVTSLAPQFYSIYKVSLESRNKNREQELAEKKQEMEQEDKAMQHMNKIVEEYQRQIETLRRLEIENAELRPLVLKNGLLEQKNTQLEEDKSDWKAYALLLTEQMEKKNIIPPPFRRLPHNGDTQERLKTISQKMKAIRTESEKDKVVDESPTLVFPEDDIKKEAQK